MITGRGRCRCGRPSCHAEYRYSRQWRRRVPPRRRLRRHGPRPLPRRHQALQARPLQPRPRRFPDVRFRRRLAPFRPRVSRGPARFFRALVSLCRQRCRRVPLRLPPLVLAYRSRRRLAPLHSRAALQASRVRRPRRFRGRRCNRRRDRRRPDLLPDNRRRARWFRRVPISSPNWCSSRARPCRARRRRVPVCLCVLRRRARVNRFIRDRRVPAPAARRWPAAAQAVRRCRVNGPAVRGRCIPLRVEGFWVRERRLRRRIRPRAVRSSAGGPCRAIGRGSPKNAISA